MLFFLKRHCLQNMVHDYQNMKKKLCNFIFCTMKNYCIYFSFLRVLLLKMPNTNSLITNIITSCIKRKCMIKMSLRLEVFNLHLIIILVTGNLSGFSRLKMVNSSKRS